MKEHVQEYQEWYDKKNKKDSDYITKAFMYTRWMSVKWYIELGNKIYVGNMHISEETSIDEKDRYVPMFELHLDNNISIKAPYDKFQEVKG